MIPDTHLTETCKIGQGADCCSYLVAGSGGMMCAKGTGIEAVLTARREQRAMVAMGDNCEGWKT